MNLIGMLGGGAVEDPGKSVFSGLFGFEFFEVAGDLGVVVFGVALVFAGGAVDSDVVGEEEECDEYKGG